MSPREVLRAFVVLANCLLHNEMRLAQSPVIHHLQSYQILRVLTLQLIGDHTTQYFTVTLLSLYIYDRKLT